MTLVDEVKSRLTIVDVVSDYITLDNPTSRTPKALCPFHEERTPSFSISVDHGSWRCWGACADGGDMFSFVMRREGIEFKEALGKLARKAGVEGDFRNDGGNDRKRNRSSEIFQINSVAEDFFARQLEGAQGTAALAYLESRGIDAQTARRRNIGFAPGGVNSLMAYLKSVGANSAAAVSAGLVTKGEDETWRDMFINRITISIRDARGNIVGFGARAMGDAQPKYLNTKETSVFNKSKLLYGHHWATDAIRASGRAIVVEGYMDVIAAQERGYKNVVACMGTSLTAEQLRVLSTILPGDTESPGSVVLCLDADEAGRSATLRGMRTAMAEYGGNAAVDVRVAAPVISQSGQPKDPDEAIRSNGAEWIASVDAAENFMEFAIRSSVENHNLSTERGQDAALNDVEPYFESIPPRTFEEQRLLATLSASLDTDVDQITNLLALKRAARRQTIAEQIQPARTNGRRTRSSNVAQFVAAATGIQPRHELELLACMIQHEFAIDHATYAEAHHFSDPVRSRVFENLRIGGNINACIERINGDAEALELVDRLRDRNVAEDQAAVIQIAEDCARRTRREYLIRNKKREVQLAKENGNMFRDGEDMDNAVNVNREIRELVVPQQLVPRQ